MIDKFEMAENSLVSCGVLQSICIERAVHNGAIKEGMYWDDIAR